MGVDWQSVITTAFLGIGGTAAISWAGAWLMKTSLKEWLARETEAFKIQLQTSAQIELENLKNSLQMAATEHQVKFSRMHEKRAEVIEEVFKRLTLIQQSAERFVLTSENSPDLQHKDEWNNIRHNLIEYSGYIEQHRIFLPKEVCELLKDHLVHINKTVHLAGAYGGKHYLNPASEQRSAEAFTKAYDAFNVDIPAAKQILESEFRKILGAESNEGGI